MEVNMTNEVIERRKRFWLTWLELDWETVRENIISEMHSVGMSQEDLAYELRRNGYPVTKATISNWLGRRPTVKRPPTMDALQALVTVFARVSAGDWAKGAYLSEDDPAYAFGPGSGDLVHSHHVPKYRHEEPESQAS
jgi:transcriptional regulator with XRE-family HTH domain